MALLYIISNGLMVNFSLFEILEICLLLIRGKQCYEQGSLKLATPATALTDLLKSHGQILTDITYN